MPNTKLSIVASLAEIVASVGVIVSLAFVGVQMMNSNLETRAATTQAALETEMYLIATVADHADVWDKVMTGQSLANGAEQRTGIVLFNLLMTEGESRFRQFNDGYLDAETWEARRDSLRLMVRLPIYEEWRATAGGINHFASFLQLLDGLAESAN